MPFREGSARPFLYQLSVRETGAKELEMLRGKKHTPEQIVSLLRQIEVCFSERQDDASSLSG